MIRLKVLLEGRIGNLSRTSYPHLQDKEVDLSVDADLKEVVKPGFEQRAEQFRQTVEKASYAHTKKHFKELTPPTFTYDKGRKFWRMVRNEQGRRGVYCFLDVATGDILKADGWKRPAKHPRGNIFSPDMLKGVGAYGADYIRGGPNYTFDKDTLSEDCDPKMVKRIAQTLLQKYGGDKRQAMDYAKHFDKVSQQNAKQKGITYSDFWQDVQQELMTGQYSSGSKKPMKEGSFDGSKFTKIWQGMTDKEKQPIKAKANWEQMTVTAVMRNYPDMIPKRFKQAFDDMWIKKEASSEQWAKRMARTNAWKKANPTVANAKRAAKEKEMPWLRKQKPLPVKEDRPETGWGHWKTGKDDDPFADGI